MNIYDPFAIIPERYLSDQTLRVYRSDWKAWLTYCDDNGLTALPINTESYTDYLDSIKDDISFSTMGRKLAVAKSAHKYNNLSALAFPLRTKVIGMDIKSRKKKVKQAPAMNLKMVQQICETPAITVRNRALVSIMFDAMLRGADAQEIRWQDIITPESEGGIRAYVEIYKTKGMLRPDADRRALSARTMSLLAEYHKESSNGFKKPEHEAIFPLHINTIKQIYTSISKIIGQRFTSHSPRVGATVDMIEAGIGEVDVCVTAGWSNVEMVRRYARNAKAQNGGMVKLMNRTGETKWLEKRPDWLQFHEE